MATEILRKNLFWEWSRVLEGSASYMEWDTGDLRGVARLQYIRKVTAPLVVKSQGKPLCIADDGFFWLQMGPAGTHWWLTAAFDEKRELVQYYFDITRKNCVKGENSWFEDLMLDVVMTPGGTPEILDGDELEEALARGRATIQEYEMAWAEARALAAALPGREGELRAFCEKALTDLAPQIYSKTDKD